MASSHLTVAPTLQSNIQINPLKLEANQQALQTFLQLIKTCIGPHGKLKIIQNSCGGHATVTSNSSRLFQILSISNPFLRLVIGSVKNYLSSFGDGGLFTSLIILFLLEKSLRLSLSKSLISNLLEYFSNLITSYLELPECTCRISVNFDNVSHLMSVVDTILSSKPGCTFTSNEKNHISLVILRAFLNCVPNPELHKLTFGQICFITQEGPSAIETKLISGVVVEYPYTVYSADNLILQKLLVKSSGSEGIKVVLFTISLAGDVQFSSPQLEVPVGFDVWNHILDILKQMGEQLIQSGVDIVACQKVVHPLLRKYLENHSVLVIEKLGIKTANYFEYLSGAIPVKSLTISKWDTVFGCVHSLKPVTLGRKKYLILQNNDRILWTIVLCNRTEEILEESKVVCRQAFDALYRILKSSHALFGGGCTEVVLAAYLENKVREELADIAYRTRCSESQVLQVLNVVKECLHEVAVSIHQCNRLEFITDTIHHHLWMIKYSNLPSDIDTCMCGKYIGKDIPPDRWSMMTQNSMVSKETLMKNFPVTLQAVKTKNVLLDEISARINAFKIAFEISSLLVKTGICIIDRN